MTTINPYLLKKDEYEKLHEKFQAIDEKIKEIERTEKIPIMEKMNSIRNTCNHQDENGRWASVPDGQDPGSGRNYHHCSICYADI